MRFMPLLILIIAGCTSPNKSSDPTYEELADLAKEEGAKISALAQKVLGNQLKEVIMENGPANAVKFCNTAAYPILDTLNTELNVTIKRVSLRIRNPENEPTSSQRRILENYSSNLEKGDTLRSQIEVLNQRQLNYAQPIVLNNPICLNCHGEVGSQISSETFNLIRELYPDDNATNHKMGELRGMWSITFDREELIKYFQSLK